MPSKFLVSWPKVIYWKNRKIEYRYPNFIYGLEKSGTLEKLMYRIYDNDNAAWGDTGMIHESTLPVEEPAVAIPGNG
jgi:hypothetical protein